MPITFPNDKTGIIDPGTGELETGDLYRASNGVLYEYNASDGSWTGPTELGGTGEPEDGVPFPLPRNQALVLRDPEVPEEFLVTENTTDTDAVDDGIYIVYDVS